jgi:predicted CopG family antitoxin
LIGVSEALDRATTITVTERTRRHLEAVKGENESFDEFLESLLEESAYGEEFFREIDRRWSEEKRVPGTRVLRRVGLS